MSSQYGEDKIIHKFFGGKRNGRFLDIGAYDGKTFSNTFALAERGWSGVCVEASPQCFLQLQKTYAQNSNVVLICGALNSRIGCYPFYDSGGAVASLSKSHMKTWKENQGDFKTIHVFTITPDRLLQTFPGPYDFISIDIEGKSLDVLALFPELRTLGVKLICVEAYDDVDRKTLERIMAAWGYVFLSRTEENAFYKVK